MPTAPADNPPGIEPGGGGTPDDMAENLAENTSSATAGARLRAWLQKPGALVQHRALIVLLVSIPLWLYAATWDIVTMLFDDAADGKGASFGEVVQRVLTRLLLLPLLVGAYLLAVRVRAVPHRMSRYALYQIAIGLGFSLLTRPALVVSYYLTNRAYAATHDLAQALALIGPWQAWFATTVQYSIVYLLGLVLIFGLNVFLRFKSEQLKASQLRSKWLEAKLGTLRGQLNPHFFFNSLNTIVALIHADPDRAERLLMELSALLRKSLSEAHHEFTTVKEEAGFLDRYLAVMKARYEDRLHVNMQLEPETYDCTIPTFLLVPLVENAIKHGVAKVPGGDTVKIAGRRSGEYLLFTVRNAAAADGAEIGDDAYSGFGLRNTRRRLTAIYGNRHHFESARDPRGGWQALVRVPVEIGVPPDALPEDLTVP